MKELVVYVRNSYCPDISRTREFLQLHEIPHREINADVDPGARQRVLAWTGFLSFPTLVVSQSDSVEPVEPPVPLRPGQSPRDVDRGTMLTEASTKTLENWLRRNGFIS